LAIESNADTNPAVTVSSKLSILSISSVLNELLKLRSFYFIATSLASIGATYSFCKSLLPNNGPVACKFDL
jgi:hypothetical protein